MENIHLLDGNLFGVRPKVETQSCDWVLLFEVAGTLLGYDWWWWVVLGGTLASDWSAGRLQVEQPGTLIGSATLWNKISKFY